MHSTVSLADVYRARQVVARYLPTTPLLHSPGLSRRTGAEVFVKYENLSPIRSFKARGGIYCLSRLASDKAGVVCASTGNHGQGIALAARLFGRRAVVVVPQGTIEKKVVAIRGLGADLRVVGQDLAESVAIAERIAADEDLVYVEDGEHPDILAGCATLALEVLEQQPDLTSLLAPVGGGNLLAACALVVKAIRPDVAVVGVQSEAAPAVYEAWRSGDLTQHRRCDTFAGGLATSYACRYVFPFIRAGVDDVLLVADAALRDAAVVMLAETGHLPEGAGAAGVAALLAHPVRFAGRRVVLLLTGSNFEPGIWAALTSGLTSDQTLLKDTTGVVRRLT
jgi:threonine dehydratase